MKSRHQQSQSLKCQHPWEHLEPHLQTLRLGEIDRAQRATPQYFDAVETINAVLVRCGLRKFGQWCFRNPHLASLDAASEWWAMAYGGGLTRCKPDLPIYPFVFVMFGFACVNVGRREGRCKERANGDQVAVSFLPPCELEQREAADEERQLIEAIHVVVPRLPTRLRQAIGSQIYEQLPAAVAAAKYSTTESIMNQRRCRARKRIREMLGDDGFDRPKRYRRRS